MTINKLNGTECGTEIAKIINRLISEKSDTDLGNLSAIGQAILDGKSSISLDNLSAAGQAILDKKVEVEALLAQNGYAKFTWKENNQISNLIINWGSGTGTDYNFACSYTTQYISSCLTVYNPSTARSGMSGVYLDDRYCSISKISFVKDYISTNKIKSLNWITIGY